MVTNRRVVSLDVFRGITVALMILVNYLAVSQVTPAMLIHAPWNGLTLADLVFPSFLFIVGVSMAYSFKKRSEQPSRVLWGHFIYRVVALFAIGVFINWISGKMSLEGLMSVRIMGVLQLIALASLFAALLARSKPRWVLIAAVSLILIHSYILLAVGAPDVIPGTLTQGNTIDDWIDVQILTPNNMYTAKTDPEGILSIIPATALVLFGMFFGKNLQTRRFNRKNLGTYGGWGSLLILLGLLISTVLPINKQLWTSSFILITAGIGILFLSFLYAYLDVKPRKSIFLAALPLGRNALVIYILSIFMAIFLHMNLFKGPSGYISVYDILSNNLINLAGETWGILLWGLLIIVFWGLIAYGMYRRKIFIKL
ncbi:MAG TPA: heparan-alpha-glucosaminide N-acetyltransferase domain-containing protein [Methanobacteriaceae archaeon]|nr:heparan-alpha-glucosaminide N-acetyltransferase domain-containing protein [Methanobacteriaceae archaeon]